MEVRDGVLAGVGQARVARRRFLDLGLDLEQTALGGRQFGSQSLRRADAAGLCSRLEPLAKLIERRARRALRLEESWLDLALRAGPGARQQLDQTPGLRALEGVECPPIEALLRPALVHRHHDLDRKSIGLADPGEEGGSEIRVVDRRPQGLEAVESLLGARQREVEVPCCAMGPGRLVSDLEAQLGHLEVVQRFQRVFEAVERRVRSPEAGLRFREVAEDSGLEDGLGRVGACRLRCLDASDREVEVARA